MDYDLIIIGGGVTGNAVARYSSRYDMHTLLIERHSDVCEETSKANSGIVHAGYDPVPGTLKASLNRKGNEMLRKMAPVLGYDLVNNGAFVLCFDEHDHYKVEELYCRAFENGIEGCVIMYHDEILKKEPNISDDVYSGLWCPTSSIVCPFGLTVALAENAAMNGVEYHLSESVADVSPMDGGWKVSTDKGVYTARAVVNAAGVHADTFNNMVSTEKLEIKPRAGEYVLLDRSEGESVHATLFQTPTNKGKGILVTPTTHGNILVGPNAVFRDSKEDTGTTAEGLEYIETMGKKSVPSVNYRKVITSFTGLRAHLTGGSDDFVIGEASGAPGFFNCAGIESPGLTCSLAIGEMVSDLVRDYLGSPVNEDFIEGRKGFIEVRKLSKEERNALIKENPLYGNIICRCEEISEGEIVDAIRHPVGATTLDGVKRRCRAGMGRCQGGFCSPKVMEIIARETGVDIREVRKNDEGSEVLR